MLGEVAAGRAHEQADVAPALAGRLAAIMDHGHRGDVRDRTDRGCPLRQVEVLEIKKEALVEPAQPLERRPPEEHERAARVLDPEHGVTTGHVPHLVPREPTGKAPAQAPGCEPAQGEVEHRRRPLAEILLLAPFVDDPRAEQDHAWMAFHEPQPLHQRLAVEQDVVVEDQVVAPPPPGDREIVAAAVAEVAVTRQHGHRHPGRRQPRRLHQSGQKRRVRPFRVVNEPEPHAPGGRRRDHRRRLGDAGQRRRQHPFLGVVEDDRHIKEEVRRGRVRATGQPRLCPIHRLLPPLRFPRTRSPARAPEDNAGPRPLV